MLVTARGCAIAMALAVSAPKIAGADETKERCVAAYEDAQRLRKAADLVGAHDKLSICANDACPDAAKQDCATWLREVDLAIPTIIVSARNEAGSDIPDFRVLVDDQLLAIRAGLATEVNPGTHRIRIEADGFTPYEETLVANEREKGRLLRTTLRPKVTVVAPPPLQPKAPSWPWPYVVGGLALGVVTVGVTLDVIGTIDLNHLRSTCAPTCPVSERDSAKTTINAGDVVVAFGVATATLAIVLWVVRPRESKVANLLLRGEF